MTSATSIAKSWRHVVVLGMHRSGTSAVANAVFRLGLEMPGDDLIAPGPFNERGYWESRRFVTFNDSVLQHLGGTWSAPPAPLEGWEHSDDPSMFRLRSAAQEFYRRELSTKPMVLKDPRLCITLPLWRTVGNQPPVAILVLRDPLEVARSLEFRNGFPLTLGLSLWCRYVQQSVASANGLPVFVAEYSNLVRDPRQWISELTSFFRQCGVPFAENRIDEAVEAIEPELHHHRDDGVVNETIASSPILAELGQIMKVLQDCRGGHERWSSAVLAPEPAWVDDVIRLVAAGEMVAFANEAAQQELKWIKRSRLFSATRAIWHFTSTGPVLSASPTPPAPSERDDSSEQRPSSEAPRLNNEKFKRWMSSSWKAFRPNGKVIAGGQIPHEDNPIAPNTLGEFRLFAVIKSWMDEDIIEATVRNAFAHGVEKVYLVDNASSDATVQTAVAAGAEVAEVYESDVFDGRLVQSLVNAVVARESLRCGSEHVWWLLLDSDEFPEGPDGVSLREYLAGLDRRFRIVGSSFMNHLPSGKPENIQGFHPIDFQPRCYPFEPANNPPCPLGHWKHPLQRFDRHGQFVLSSDGAHLAFASERLVEPTEGIVIHHFQYREEALTRAKLEMVCGPNSSRSDVHESAGFRGFDRRRRSLDAVYAQRWEAMDIAPNRRANSSLDPQSWPNLARTLRWYTFEGEQSECRRDLSP